MELYSAFRGASQEIEERFTRVKATWLKIEMQLDFMKRIEGLMSERHRVVQESLIEMLYTRLKTVTYKLQSVTPSGSQEDFTSTEGGTMCRVLRRSKYAWVKDSLDRAIENLDDWQRRSDPSWYLIMRIASTQIDTALLKDDAATMQSFPSTRAIRDDPEDKPRRSPGIFLPPSKLAEMKISNIPFCETRVAQRASSHQGSQTLVLSDIQCRPGANVMTAMKSIRDLARKLQHSDPKTFALLDCKGVIKQVDTSTRTERIYLTMVLRVPSGLDTPRSLRHRLMTDMEDNTIVDKINIARELAKSINYVHVFGFVHKNVRPETILTFRSPNVSTASTFLVGFDNFRREEGQTYLQGDDDWEKNLYRHPSRQGNAPEAEYSMQHDIYSLGVCLLEIGLWASFVDYDQKGRKACYAPALELTSKGSELEGPAALKAHFVTLARQRLPRTMGRRYTAVVETCLTCLDRDNADFGNESEFLDEDGILVGVRYIEKVWLVRSNSGNWIF